MTKQCAPSRHPRVAPPARTPAPSAHMLRARCAPPARTAARDAAARGSRLRTLQFNENIRIRSTSAEQMDIDYASLPSALDREPDATRVFGRPKRAPCRRTPVATDVRRARLGQRHGESGRGRLRPGRQPVPRQPTRRRAQAGTRARHPMDPCMTHPAPTQQHQHADLAEQSIQQAQKEVSVAAASTVCGGAEKETHDVAHAYLRRHC